MAQLTIEQANRQAMELLRAGRLREAEALAQQVLQYAPDSPTALQCLGLIAHHAGQFAEAVNLLRRAAANLPTNPEYQYNLSEPLRALGRDDEAHAALREAIRLRPDFAQAHLNLGALLARAGKWEEAIGPFREAIRLRPQDPTGYLNLSKSMRALERLDEVEELRRKAIAVAPDFAPSYSMLGSLLREEGRIGEAVESFRRAIALKPDFREAHSNLCYALYFDPDVSCATIFQEHLAWAQRFAEPLRGQLKPHDNDRSPDRKLRIGYVSPELRQHVVAFFMEPILEHHDRERFEVYAYADVSNPDEVSRRLQSNVDVWRMTSGIPDERLTDIIRQDKIDILIDLSLHMRASRLRTFALKPAPVQITHLGYCGSSGLRTMDWCVIDPHMMSPGCERFFSERLLPLPRSYWAYRAAPNSPDVGPPPAARNGYVTFGSLNSLGKVNSHVLRAWAALLSRVANSRLVTHVPGGAKNPSILKRFADHGIPPDRLETVEYRPRDQYLDAYNRIDIALDPFPYGGGTTSLDAAWMGVPLVTLAGQSAVARAGVTILTNLGLPELIARAPEQYLDIAAGLAANFDRLSALRSSLRERMRNSPLMDEAGYIRDLEEAYRLAWRAWCGG
jgi:predicted O-linked N-acetylglucosamine transferase (SPINDLY family)